MRKQGIGIRAEERVANLLRMPIYRRAVIKCSYNSPYDLLVDGLRVEVKCAAPQGAGNQMFWHFNLHRHGVLNEDTDIYILRLEEVPFRAGAIHMVLRAPVGVMVFSVGMGALLNQQYAAAVADFYALARGEYGRKEVAA